MNTVMEASWLRPGDYFIYNNNLGFVVEIGVDKYYVELRTGQTMLRNMTRTYQSCSDTRTFPVPLRPNDLVTKIEIPKDFFIPTNRSTDDNN